MSSNQIKLVSLGVSAYAGLGADKKASVEYPIDISEDFKTVDKEQGLLICFPEGCRVAVLSGDQGVGKTSLINCLLEATANIAAPDNSINKTDGKRYNFRFYGKDGMLYEVRGTKATYVLEQIKIDGPYGEPVLNEKNKEQISELKSPKEMIKKLIGPAGVSPLELKNMKPADQIKWIRGLYTLDADSLKLEYENKQNHDKAYKERTIAGNKHDEYKTLTKNSPYYEKWQEWEKKFESKEFDNVEQDVKDAQDKFITFQAAENAVKNLRDNIIPNIKERIADQELSIAKLEETLRLEKLALQEKRDELSAKEKKLSDGQIWMEENKQVVKDNEQAVEKISKAQEFRRQKTDFEQMKLHKKQMDHFETEYQRLTSIIDACNKVKKEFVRAFTPEVEGLEICIPDEDEKREGIIFKGKGSEMWCESEAWEVAASIWEVLGVRMIYIENASSLGSAAIEKLNHFANTGGYIIGSMMNRSEKNLKVTIANKLPE